MKRGTHHNHTVQNVFNKYGLDLFTFEILEYCKIEDLLVREMMIENYKKAEKTMLFGGKYLRLKIPKYFDLVNS